MEEKEIKSWDEFEKALAELNKEIKEIKKHNKAPLTPITEPIFRGQADQPDDELQLKTTLERYIKNLKKCDKKNAEPSFRFYYDLMRLAKPQIESLTGQSWELDEKKYEDWVNNVLKPLKYSPEYPPSYDYMIYLRHHGFPSPLLDWSKSPYIAAFFAYRYPVSHADGVSIYAYVESTGQGKTICNTWISSFGAYVRTHKRHFLQQSKYTICVKETNGGFYYSNHDEVFRKGANGEDRGYKFKLPISKRVNFLKKLDSMNINAFSLFGTEDALMETVALRELDFRSL